MRKELPEGFGMALYSVKSAYYKNRRVKNTVGTLCFSGKIRMPRSIEKRQLRAAVFHNSLLGENGNTS